MFTAVSSEHFLLLLVSPAIVQTTCVNVDLIPLCCPPKVIMHREERVRALEKDLSSLCIVEERAPAILEGTLPLIKGGVEARVPVEKMYVW